MLQLLGTLSLSPKLPGAFIALDPTLELPSSVTKPLHSIPKQKILKSSTDKSRICRTRSAVLTENKAELASRQCGSLLSEYLVFGELLYCLTNRTLRPCRNTERTTHVMSATLHDAFLHNTRQHTLLVLW